MTHDHDNEHDHVEEIDCLEAIDNLYAYLDGELKDPEAVMKFEKHLEHCRACYSRRELELALNDRLQTEAKGEVPASLQDRLRKIVDEL